MGPVAQHHPLEDGQLTSGLLIWSAAVAAFVFGLWQARYNPSTELALFIGIIATGVFLRIFRLGGDVGLNHDAAWNGLHAIRIVRDAVLSPYVPEAWGRETMFHYIIVLFQVIFGPTQSAIQLASTYVGIATLVVFYFLVRRLFGVTVALVATFLLSVSGWHIVMSNVSWRAVLVPLFMALKFWLLVRAVQGGHIRDFAIAGLLLGLSLYTYEAARMLPIMALAYLAYEAIREPEFLRTRRVHLVLFGLTALVAFAPMGWFALHNWHAFTGRTGYLWVGAQIEEAGSIEPLLTNVRLALGLFQYRANGNDYFVDEPLLDIPVAVLFPLGLVYSITKFRQPGHFLMLLMLALILSVGIASGPNGNRILGATIPTTLFAAVVLVEAWRWLSAAYPRFKDAFTVALVGVLLYAGYVTYDSYLGPNRRELPGSYLEATTVGHYMRRIAPSYDIHALAGNWPEYTLTYLSYQGVGDPFVPRYHYYTDASEFPQAYAARGRGTSFIG